MLCRAANGQDYRIAQDSAQSYAGWKANRDVKEYNTKFSLNVDEATSREKRTKN